MILLERIVRKSVFDNCWIWTGNCNSKGYAQIKIDGKTHRLARVSYYFFYRCWPNEVDHLCRNRRCWNPDHLEDVTHRVNIRRAAGWYQTEDGTWFCANDHEMNGENTSHLKRGAVRCRTCHREKMREYRQ